MYQKSISFQYSGSNMVVFAIVMLTAIKFHDQSFFQTGKINDKSFNLILPSEFQT